MKITKRQLRKIIREEKARLLEVNAGYVKLDRAAASPDVQGLSKNEAHTALVDTILELEKVLGEAGVREALSELGYQ